MSFERTVLIFWLISLKFDVFCKEHKKDKNKEDENEAEKWEDYNKRETEVSGTPSLAFAEFMTSALTTTIKDHAPKYFFTISDDIPYNITGDDELCVFHWNITNKLNTTFDFTNDTSDPFGGIPGQIVVLYFLCADICCEMDCCYEKVWLKVLVKIAISTALFLACMICAISMPCMAKMCGVAIKDPTRMKDACCRANRPAEEFEIQDRRSTFTESFSELELNADRKQTTIQPVNYNIL